MAMTEVARATVTIVPNMEGSQKAITDELTGAGTTAGNKAGTSAGKALSSSLGSSLGNVGKSMTKTLTVPLSAAGTASVAAATKFDTAFTKLRTIADTSEISLEDLKEQVIDLSNETGLGASEVAEAAYSAISAGQSTGDALEFVATSAKLAKGGFTEVATATDVLTTALNAYGMSADQATHVSDVLISTQNLGKTTVDELASSMGKVIPTASAAGVGIEDLASQYVALTKNGIATAETTTYINSMLNELTKGGTDANESFEKAAGVTFPEYIKQGHSTAEAMALLGEYAEKNGKKINDMFGSAEAAKAANVLSSHTDDAKQALEEMNTTIGQTQDAFDLMEQTTAVKMEKMKTNLENTAITIGATILPVLEPAIETISSAITKVTEVFSAFPEGAQTAIIAIAGVVAAAGPLVSVGGKVIGGISKIRGGFTGLSGNLLSFGGTAATAGASSATAATGFSTMAGAALQLVAIGASFVMVGEGIKLIADAAVKIAEGGLPAAAAMLEMVAAISALMGVAAALGPALTAGAAGIAAFGAAALGIGAGIDLACTGIAKLNESFGTVLRAANDSKDGITQITESISGGFVDTIDAVGRVIHGALDGVSDIIKSIGTAAVDCGRGMSLMADGVKKIVDLKLTDLALSMGAVAKGIKEMSQYSNEINLTSTALSAFTVRLTAAGAKFNDFQTAVTTAMTAATNTVKLNLQEMQKAFATTTFKFNNIKLPHFKMNGSFDAEAGTVPTVSVEWYAQAAEKGAIFSSPQIIGVGDASQPELLIGEDTLYKNIREASESAPGDVYVYIGDEQLDAIIRRSQKRMALRSGGR